MKQILTVWNEGDREQEALDALQLDDSSWKSLLFHIYSGEADEGKVSRLLQQLRTRFPAAEIAGTVSAGEIRDGRMAEDGILISAMVFDSTDVKVHTFEHVKGNERSVGGQILELLEQTPDLKAVELLLPGAEMDTWILFEEIEKCDRSVQIFGGYAGGHTLECPDHFVYDRNGVLHESVLVITYAGKDFAIDAGRTVGWQTLGRKYRITKADKKRIIEIDHRPAVELYKRFLQVEGEGAAAESLEFPLLITVDGEELMRGTTFIDTDGSIVVAGYVSEGMDIQLSYGNPADIVVCVDERLEELRRFQPQAILLYSCLARKSFWEEFVDIEMVPFASLGSTAGFHTWGEVERAMESGTVFEYNQTLLSIGMREGPRQGKELPQARVDDSVLRGQASIMKRLAKLVIATTGELELAYQRLEQMNEQLSAANESLQKMADYDALTGIYNRGKIEMLINQALDNSSRTGRKVSLVMIDVDYFKQINDTYGHAVGDNVLQSLADLLKEAAATWPGASAGRWGGEEFFILLPSAEESDALEFSKQLHTRIEQYAFPEIGKMTVSMGVISARGIEDRRSIFTQVDDALYEAKNTGRNRIVQCDGND